MANRQRLVVLGDIHYCSTESTRWERAIEDINQLAPDQVLLVGDLTGGASTGTPEGMKAAVAMLDSLQAPWHTVIGNHDLQATEFTTDEQAVASFLSFTGRKTPWFRFDHGPLTIIGLSNTQWRRNTINKNEIVFEEDQIEWCRAELASIPDRPVFILAHVPPLGSGLMMMGELHANVGNACANQNHVPSSVLRLAREYPNVLMWFSGHNHLGQHYRDAISMRLGVHFVHVGIVGRQSRDGHRHSRVIDIHEDRLLIRTFDHSLRRIDESLDYCEPHSLADLLNYRRTIDKSRFVPTDPATMRQGPGPSIRNPHAHRFAFLSDAHITEHLSPCQERVIDWTLRQVLGHCVESLILGGDLTHHASTPQAKHFVDALHCPRLPTWYLPGNNETTTIEVHAALPKVNFVRTIERLEGWPGHVFALATTTSEDATTAVRSLAEQLPATGSVLVLAHFPPAMAGEETLALLTRPGLDIHWVCGHRHSGSSTVEGAITVHICGGLDPIKVRNHTPELLICDWDGNDLQIQRIHAPDTVLQPPPGKCNPIGLAFRGSPETLLQTAIDEEAPILQFRWPDVSGPLSADERHMIDRFRQTFDDGFLSLHLPNFTVSDDGVDIGEMKDCLKWAEEVGVDDLTIHLPSVPASRLFDETQALRTDNWAGNCLETYCELARRALTIGAQLSLENVYNKRRVADADETLSTRPWHLLRFVEAIRSKLATQGYTAEQVAKVGIIFDSGHAFRDPKVSKEHGLADWLQQIAPYLQLAHIHQTVSINGKMTNHQPIDNAVGPQINHSGLLPVITETTTRTVPLLIEVRTREGALASLECLRRIQ